ncbi:MAG: hypothetical protein ACI9O0_001432 [Paracoccaceae bacterium]|jgi:hypothetical protein
MRLFKYFSDNDGVDDSSDEAIFEALEIFKS